MARKARGLPTVDLTNSNFSELGLRFPAEELEVTAVDYLRTRVYSPSARGLPKAREAISRWYANRLPALEIDPENIFITSSTSEAYSLLFSLLADPGDEVLGPPITYPLFEHLAAHSRLELKHYKVKDHSYDFSGLEETTRVRAVLIVSPHNPTGTILRERDDALASSGLPIIADEVFAEFYRLSPPPAVGSLYPENPVFHLGGISKMCGLADFKLGWIALNQVAATKYGVHLEILNDTFLSANQLTQELLPEILELQPLFAKQVNERIKTSCDLLSERQSKLFQFTPPDGGISGIIRLPDGTSEDEIALRMLGEGFLIHPGYYFGIEQPSLVLSLILEPEVLSDGISALVRLTEEGASVPGR